MSTNGADGLDDNDIDALKQITLRGPFLNYALRNDLFELAALVSRLDAAFRKVSFPEERTVYRGVPDKMLSDFCPGDRIVDPAFMSASLRRDVAEFFGASVLEITIPIGAKAVFLGELSIPSHLEVLINRGSTLSIEQVDVPARTARATLLSADTASAVVSECARSVE